MNLQNESDPTETIYLIVLDVIRRAARVGLIAEYHGLQHRRDQAWAVAYKRARDTSSVVLTSCVVDGIAGVMVVLRARGPNRPATALVQGPGDFDAARLKRTAGWTNLEGGPVEVRNSGYYLLDSPLLAGDPIDLFDPMEPGVNAWSPGTFVPPAEAGGDPAWRADGRSTYTMTLDRTRRVRRSLR